MAHILFITPYFPPEKAAPAVRLSETAKLLTRRGYRVTVLTTVPNYPTGIVPLEYRGHLVQQEMLEGVHVVRVWSYTTPNKGFLKRIVAHLSFGSWPPRRDRCRVAAALRCHCGTPTGMAQALSIYFSGF